MEKLQSRGLKMKKSIVLMLSLFFILISSTTLVQVTAETTYDLQVTFTSNPTVVAPGTNGYLEVILESIGTGTISNIDIYARSWDSSVLQPKGNWNVYVGDLDSGDSTSLLYEFYVPSTATPGLYQVVFDIDYSPGVDIRQTAMVKVEDSTVLDLVSVIPSSINVGEPTTLVFNLTNNGGSTAGNILFTWEDPSDLILPVGSDNRIPISSIPAGNYTEIPVDVVASPSISPGVYPLTITIEFYERTGTKQTITSEVGIQVGGTTDFEIVLQDSMGLGTTFAVANSGSNVASSVIVSIASQLNYMVSGASSVSLGNLDAGDYTLATFQISSVDRENNSLRPDKSSMERPSDIDFSRPDGFRGSESESNDLIVEVSYTDLFGVRHTVEKEVDYSSSSSNNVGSFSGGKSGLRPGESSGIDSGTMYIIIGVVGIIVIVAILKIGKRKKK
jgi:hypothetical protein